MVPYLRPGLRSRPAGVSGAVKRPAAGRPSQGGDGACAIFHKRLGSPSVANRERVRGQVEEPRRDGGDRSAGPRPSEYLGHGLTWAASTLLFLWLGTKADAWLGTEPWLALGGAFVGAAAGFYHMIHHLVVAPRDRERKGGGG